MIKFYCPAGHRCKADASLVGRKVLCSQCQVAVVVPAVSEPKRPPAAGADPGPPAATEQTEIAAEQTEVAAQRLSDECPAGPLAGERLPDQFPPLPLAGEGQGVRVAQGRPSSASATAAALSSPSPVPDEEGPISPRQAWQQRKRRKPEFPAAGPPPADDGQGPAVAVVAAPSRPMMRRIVRPVPTLPPVYYEPEARLLIAVHRLAILLVGVLVLSVVPVVWTGNFDLGDAPRWAQAAALLAALQTVYLIWMLAAPDWSSIWIVMLVFALVAALYGMATAIAIATPPDKPVLFDLGAIRETAKGWCAIVMLTSLLATYFAGRTAAHWRRAYDLEMARRRRAILPPSFSSDSPWA